MSDVYLLEWTLAHISKVLFELTLANVIVSHTKVIIRILRVQAFNYM